MDREPEFGTHEEAFGWIEALFDVVITAAVTGVVVAAAITAVNFLAR